jgi:hypothetical protein
VSPNALVALAAASFSVGLAGASCYEWASYRSQVNRAQETLNDVTSKSLLIAKKIERLSDYEMLVQVPSKDEPVFIGATTIYQTPEQHAAALDAAVTRETKRLLAWKAQRDYDRKAAAAPEKAMKGAMPAPRGKK